MSSEKKEFVAMLDQVFMTEFFATRDMRRNAIRMFPLCRLTRQGEVYRVTGVQLSASAYGEIASEVDYFCVEMPDFFKFLDGVPSLGISTPMNKETARHIEDLKEQITFLQNVVYTKLNIKEADIANLRKLRE